MEWRDEKKALLATIQRQEQEAVALARRFKLLEQTLKEQQKLLDRYQRALWAVRAKSPSLAAKVSTIDKKRNQSPLIKPKTCKKPRIETTEIGNKSFSMEQTWVKKKKTSDLETSVEVLIPLQVKKKMDEKKTKIFKPIVQKRNRGLASTWAEEKQKMLKKSKWEQNLELAAIGPSDKENLQVDQTSDRPKSFAYIEVVRNKEERKALLGHDCIECKKYYDALGEIGTVDAAAQKHKCSRHRARFEPYQTPDDFWRLSFPDSEPQ
ncbi:hypothetical protein KXD40_007418 [Peronospora effusa]|uniref:DNA endonuclease activator Ctp1 C-terminal domain-containing protein n=1 Tax=Peronospora effusa TaxID=542832 RepID=A0A3M6VDQ0_9STRA|nr:hypothetical protein DD238_006828 [Peronospora effusa]RQM11039.1 hypothetical protein DD237_007028 [Peronospora effusa]UIZ28861.1 hypothetical protein KXD40_007418 [Peronospora effusa]CAI5717115.1 unnamed protein product [Peronospora effusa]